MREEECRHPTCRRRTAGRRPRPGQALRPTAEPRL